MGDPVEIAEERTGISRSTLERFPLSIVLTDPHQDDNPIVYVNRAFTRMTGYDAAACIGRNCRFLQGEETDREDVARLRRAVAERQEVSVDIVNYRADGTRFVNRLLIAPLEHSDGELAYFLGIQSRAAEDAGLREQIRDLDERLREFQHRVKNHLSMILALIRLEARETGGKYALDLLAARVETLSLLYDHLASLDGAGYGPDVVPVGAYVTRICSAIQVLGDKARIRVNVYADEDEMPVDEAARLGLTLSELLTNALQHAFDEDQSGEIVVHFKRTDGAMVLTVADDGRGIRDGEWPRRDSLGGRIVLDYVDRLGADLDVQSGEGGTTVTITIRR